MGADGKGNRGEAEKKAAYKNKYVEGWFGWWRTPSDRFAALIAAFTLCLFVATCGLWIATDDLVKDAKGSGRAWVGPRNARIMVAPKSGEEIEFQIEYINSGREPALNFTSVLDAFVSTQDSDALPRIVEHANKCLATKTAVTGQVAFPSTGFSNYLFFGKLEKAQVNEALVKGDATMILQGCFIYVTVEHVRHSFFCYFYNAKVTKIENLNICQQGHYAD